MATTKRQNVCAPIRYTDAQGQEKTMWRTVGKMFYSDNGAITIKLDSIPVGQGWDGTLKPFDEKSNYDTSF